MSETGIREEICRLGRSLFERGLTPGSSGNISVKLDDGGWLVTPTNASLGSLDPHAGAEVAPPKVDIHPASGPIVLTITYRVPPENGSGIVRRSPCTTAPLVAILMSLPSNSPGFTVNFRTTQWLRSIAP